MMLAECCPHCGALKFPAGEDNFLTYKMDAQTATLFRALRTARGSLSTDQLAGALYPWGGPLNARRCVWVRLHALRRALRGSELSLVNTRGSGYRLERSET